MSKAMRILLVRHPYRFIEGSVANEVELPIGLAHIASALERAGHTVRIYDAAVRYDVASINAAWSAGQPVHVGDSWDRFAQAVAGEWNLVGISSMFYTQMPMALEAARVVRRVLPHVPIVMGGPPATVRPQDYLNEPAVDYVLRGEAERPMVAFADALARGESIENLPSLSFRADGRIQNNPLAEYPVDLDVLPMPAYHLLNLDEQMTGLQHGPKGWFTEPRRVVPIVTTRGCPFQCTFCSIHLHMGRKWRRHSVRYVLDHVRHVVTKLDCRNIYFMDDNMGLDPARFEEMLDGLLALKAEGLGITWRTPTGMRVDRLTREILRKARDAGCEAIVLAVESGSQRVLNEVMHKKLDLQQVIAVSRWCKEVGIKARAGFVIGMPGETLEEMEETIQFAWMLLRKYGIRGHPSTATPFYGTELYDVCQEKGYLTEPMTPDNCARGVQGRSMIRTPEFTPEDLARVRERFERQGSWSRYAIRQVGRAVRRAIKGDPHEAE